MSEAPKLYVNKPKKAQVKQFQNQQQQLKGKVMQSSASTVATSSSVGGGGQGGAPKLPEPPKESFARRYKFVWPLLLTVNLAVGAYLFMRTKKKDVAVEEEAPDAPSLQNPITITPTPPVIEKPSPSVPIAEPVRLLEPIAENQQRELFKWMLEEKRKVKPKDLQEKKRIDEEKAILKQFIRAESIPTF